MRIVPSSTITLYSGVEIDNGEQLAFSSVNGQNAYFASKLVLQAVPCTMIRKTGALRLEVAGSVVKNCNYLSFVNPDFDNKTVYARILDYDYINNECVEIAYAIDYWQTWMFDVDFDDMYIEREHLSEEDWDKAETNSYDPTILEFKTIESLPINKDIEKLYYEYGTSSSDDGIYCGEALASELGLQNNNIGALVILGDVDWGSLDSGTQQGDPYPSAPFYNLLTYLQTIGLCAYKLSYSTYEYFNTQHPNTISQVGYVQNNWNIGGTQLEPFTASTFDTPLTYLYFDESNYTSLTGERLSILLYTLTKLSVVDNILGIYPLSNAMMMFATARDTVITVSHDTASGQNVVNKKLNWYPFSYYRLIAPNGDVKELRIENFKAAQEGQSTCAVGMNMDIVERPNLIVGPVDYKASGTSPHANNLDFNGQEALIFSQWPTMPYSISAWESQLASAVNYTIGNNTQVAMYQRQGGMTGFEGVAGGLMDLVANNLGDLANRMINTKAEGGALSQLALNVGNTALNVGAQNFAHDASSFRVKKLEAEMADTGTKGLSSNDNAIYENLKYTRPAFANDAYHPINGDGIINYNNLMVQDIIFMRVSLDPNILAQYDNYFTHYGYTSGRCGIPRVINYVKGSTTDSEVPHWMSLNNRNTTYIKTMDCKVIYSMLPVASAIKSMFDSGVRMIKGD